MKSFVHRSSVCFTLLMVVVPLVGAQDFNWNQTSDASWSVNTNWTPSSPPGGPDGPGLFVLINTHIPAGETISLYNTGDAGGATKTVGRLDIGYDSGGSPSNSFTIASGSGGGSLVFDGNGGNAQLNELSTTSRDVIAAPVALNSSLYVTNASMTLPLILAGSVSGPGSLILSSGWLALTSNNNSYTSTVINGGDFELGVGGTTGALPPAGTISLANGFLTVNRSNATAQGVDFSSAAISGAGGITQLGSGSLTLNVRNYYSAGTRVLGGTVIATAGGALGTGPVSLIFGRLTLGNGGIAQDFISDSAALELIVGASVYLDFTGTDVVGTLMLNGTVEPPGVYNATTNPGAFTGQGSITNLAIPEPASYMLMLIGLVICGRSFVAKGKRIGAQL